MIDLNELYPPLKTYVPHRPSDPQALFLLTDQREAFYGGAVGGGKSDALLMAALQYVDVPGYAALILRRTYPELKGSSGLIHRSKQWLKNTDASWNEQDKVWTFPSGALLQFGHVATEGDMFKYDGQEYQFVGFDELTHFTEDIYDHIGFTRTRRVLDMKDIGVPIRTRATAMPIGAGYGWVRERFITNRKPGVPFVPAKAKDNPGLDVDEYAENSLGHLPEELREKLLNGDWDIFIGAAYVIDETKHFVPEFELPWHWERFESMDHGVSAPTCWLLWASDTQGNMIVADEYYEIHRKVSTHAENIKRRHKDSWWRRDEQDDLIRNVIYGDPAIKGGTGHETKLGDPASVLTEYADCGLGIALANNDRKAGFARLRERLEIDPDRPFPEWHPRYGEKGAPKLYFMSRRCPKVCKQVRSAPLQPNDKKDGGEIVDPDWETHQGHAHAALRYGAMGRFGPSKEPPDEPGPDATPAELRAHAMKELLERRHKRPDPSDYYLSL